MKIDINKRLEWLDKRLGLDVLHKEYIGFQMTELALEVADKMEQELQDLKQYKIDLDEYTPSAEAELEKLKIVLKTHEDLHDVRKCEHEPKSYKTK